MQTLLRIVLILVLFGSARQVSAHYLWVVIDRQRGEHGTADIIFEESPAAGDGSYLDHFLGTSKTWFRTVERIKPLRIDSTETRVGKKRWLRAKLPAASPRSIDCYGRFGVYTYGETNVLLHYYARNLDVNTHEDLHEVGRAEQMDLEIVPHDHQDEVELTVLWTGKPAAQRMVHIRGPKKFRKNIKTDANGRVAFVPKHPGRYTFRTSVELPTPGRDGDDEYSLIRHNGTLIMQLPLQK
jgi:hypothetical protein